MTIRQVCPMCGMEFASHYGKNRHEKLCGKNPLSRADFRCVTCGKTTNSRHELQHHMK